jgi:hypothetical protein
MMEWTIRAEIGFTHPPLLRIPWSVSFLMMGGELMIHPSLRPGPSILLKDPMDNTCPSLPGIAHRGGGREEGAPSTS